MNRDLIRSNPTAQLTMSSREIAELTDKLHRNVKRDIEHMLSELGKDVLSFERIYFDSMNRQQTEYHLDRELTEILITGYSIPLRARVIRRLHELESRQHVTIPQTLPEALRLAADLADENNSLRLVAQEQAPKVAALERLADAQGTLCLTDAAKHLGVPRKRLIDWLRDNRWIYRRPGCAHWLGYQPRLNAGWLDHKVTVIGTDDLGDQRLASQVRVTPKGLTVLARKLGGGI